MSVRKRIGVMVPSISSNKASIWAAYRAIGLTPKITGFGRLLESLAA
jgi:maleate cis-trans isomerase